MSRSSHNIPASLHKSSWKQGRRSQILSVETQKNSNSQIRALKLNKDHQLTKDVCLWKTIELNKNRWGPAILVGYSLPSLGMVPEAFL